MGQIYVRAVYDRDKTVFMNLYCKDIQPMNAQAVDQTVNEIVERTSLFFFPYRNPILFATLVVYGYIHRLHADRGLSKDVMNVIMEFYSGDQIKVQSESYHC